MRWSDESRDQVVRLRQSGMTPKNVARIFNSTPDAINGIMRRYNGRIEDRSAPVLSEEESSIAVRMRKERLAFDVIARELRRDRMVVTKHLTELGYGRLLAEWTTEMEGMVREMWGGGSSALEIAEAIGGVVTESAVSNKITRMGLPGRVRVRYRSEPKQKRKQIRARIVGSSEKGGWDTRTFLPYAEWKIWNRARKKEMEYA